MPSELEILRQQMARPYSGRPAQFEVQFRTMQMMQAKSREQVNAWWHGEAVPIIKNMTGERAVFLSEPGRCYLNDQQGAVLIAMFFKGFVLGVLDWSNTTWITLPKTEERLPDW